MALATVAPNEDRNLELQPLCSPGVSAATFHVRPTGSGARVIVEEGKDSKELLSAATCRALALVLAWYGLSTSLSLYNKKLLGNGHGILAKQPFPAPVMMSAMQFALQHYLARLVHWMGVKRTMTSGDHMTWNVFLRTILPNGMATGLDIGFSNAALAVITLSFYTMCKSSAPLFLLLFAFIWGIETPSWSLLGIMLVICTGLFMLVAGEAAFSALGFFLVMTAACLSGLRWTITQVSLQGGETGAGHTVVKGSALEVMERLTPVMSVTTAVMSMCFEPLLSAWRNSIYFSSLKYCCITMALMSVGGLLAFVMVWVEFQLISETSALTFMVAGVLKEIVTVIVAHFVYHDRFTPLNGAGLAVLLVGVSIFNWHKYHRMVQAAACKESKAKWPEVDYSPQRCHSMSPRPPPEISAQEIVSPVNGNAGKRLGRNLHGDVPIGLNLAPQLSSSATELNALV